MLNQSLIVLLLEEANKQNTGDYGRDLYAMKLKVDAFIGEEMDRYNQLRREDNYAKYKP